MPQTLQWLEPDSLAFPPLDSALTDPNGLLAVGGDLSPQRLINAYRLGIFPWFNEDEPILWWSPSPRAVLPIDSIYINRSLKKVLNRQLFTVTVNTAFEQVIHYCADAPFRKQGTWINDQMLDAYKELHALGYAHSIEVWHDKTLVGGLYGVAINGAFSGESMFYLKDNASKVALVALTDLLKGKADFIDCQISNAFLTSMGAIEIPRKSFQHAHNQAQQVSCPPDFWRPRILF